MNIQKQRDQPVAITYDVTYEVNGRPRHYEVYALTWPTLSTPGNDFLPQLFVRGLGEELNDSLHDGHEWMYIDEDEITGALMHAGMEDDELPVLSDAMIQCAVLLYRTRTEKFLLSEWVADQLDEAANNEVLASATACSETSPQ